jgi:hypothetical protein
LAESAHTGIAGLVLLAFTRFVTYAWVDDGRINQLLKEFETTSKRRLKLRTILFWSYAIASIAYLVVVVLVLKNR